MACDHYRRWERDLDLLHQLGIESYRFSIAWPRGYTQPWGLVKVDFKTQERTPKESALWYAELIGDRMLPRS